MTLLIVVVIALVGELLIGVAIGIALARRDDDRHRGGHIDLTRAAARGDLGQTLRSSPLTQRLP